MNVKHTLGICSNTQHGHKGPQTMSNISTNLSSQAGHDNVVLITPIIFVQACHSFLVPVKVVFEPLGNSLRIVPAIVIFGRVIFALYGDRNGVINGVLLILSVKSGGA